MRLLYFLFFLSFCISTKAQSIGLRMSHSLLPSDQISLRYEHWANGMINLSGGVFAEQSHKHTLSYTNFGIDILAEYSSIRHNDLPLGYRLGLGTTIQNENEPWVLKDYSFIQRLNYGLMEEGALEICLGNDFLLSLFAQQKNLFNQKLGASSFLFGLALSIRLNQQ